MRTIIQTTMTWLVVIFLITGFAVPHVCLDDSGPIVKSEQQIKAHKIALDDHNSGSKAKDGCCVSHHCCAAKVFNTPAVFSKTASYSRTIMTPAMSVPVHSYHANGLDRPPKSIA